MATSIVSARSEIRNSKPCSVRPPPGLQPRLKRTERPCVSAQVCMASTTGLSVWPSGANEYSTFGGTCGEPIVKGKRVTGFTNGEEEAVHLTKVVPFLVEDELKRLGGRYEKAADWASFVITDGRLVTGQNPASSKAAAEALLNLVV